MTETTTTTTCDICQRVVPKADTVFRVTRTYEARPANPPQDPYGALACESRDVCETCMPEKIAFLFPAR